MKGKSNLLTYVLVLVVLAMIGFLFSNKNDVVLIKTPNQLVNSSNSDLQTQSPWTWLNVTYADGSEIKVDNPLKFVLSFEDANRLSSTTDCNSLNGEYKTDGQKLTITNLASTMMYCENSLESTYSQMLQDVEQYEILDGGATLQLKLKTNGGTATFTNDIKYY